MKKNHLILDLDGTLLFGEARPSALVVPGRRRHSYMARETINLLGQIQDQRSIVLATGRSKVSVLSIIIGLKDEGINISGAAAENGGIWINHNDECECFVDQAWIETAKQIEAAMPHLVQPEFETCVALLNPQPEDLRHLDRLTEALGLQHRRLKDGNKLFILATDVDKKHALESMLGYEELRDAWGVGNDINDVDWISEVLLSAAPACAKDELLRTVRQHRGIVAVNKGHAGIAEILNALG